MLIDFILESFESLVLGPLLTKFSTLLFSQLILPGGFNLVLLSFLDSVVLGLDDARVFILAVEDAVDDHALCALSGGLVLLQEVGDSSHEPWEHLLLHSSVLWSDKDAN